MIEQIKNWNGISFQPLFINQEINNNLKLFGYCVVDINNINSIDKLFSDTETILKKAKNLPNHFFNFGQINDFGLRNASFKSIEETLIPILQPLIYKQNATMMAGTHLVKPAGEDTYFLPHQDNNMIDERKHRSYSFWIPLQDINEENGGFYVFPKSHLLGNVFRATSIPWKFKNVVPSIIEKSIPLYPKKGQAIIFDASLIHFTKSNLSQKTRIAINVLVMPIGVEIIKCINKKIRIFKDVDIYKVDMNYYLNEFCEKRPESKYLRINSVRNNFPTLRNNNFNYFLDKLID